MMKKILAFILCVLMIVSAISAQAYTENAGRVYLYVSLDGNDSASGDMDAPLQTFIGARNKIRELRAQGVAPDKGFVVYFREGSYSLKEAVKFSPEDSGTEEAPIVYRAYPGESVTVVGGAAIPEGAFKPIDDAKIKNRIIDGTARGKVLCADLKALGFDYFGEITLPGAYSFFPSTVKKPTAEAPELFINGKLMTVARYPNEGYMSISEVVDVGALPTLWNESRKSEGDWVPPEERDEFDGFEVKVKDSRVLKWTELSENTAVLTGYFYFTWADASTPLKKVSEEGIIESAYPAQHGPREGGTFYVQNLVEEIDVPGEYYLDRDAGKLYIYPPADFKDSEINMSFIEESLIQMNEANYITIKNMKITAARASGVSISNGVGNKVIGCEVEYTAGKAISVSGREAAKNGVISCYIHDTNGGVILQAGKEETLTPGENYVENCLIERYSRIRTTYNAAVSFHSVGNEARYNEIRDNKHLAIQFAGNNHKVLYNNIYDVCQEADDMGAIYGGFSWVGRGTEIKYNYVHDLKLAPHVTEVSGIRACYFDNKQAGMITTGNIFHNIQGYGVHSNGGRDTIVNNNILIDVKYGNKITTCTTLDTTDHMNGLKNAPYYKNEIWAEAYPELVNILDEKDPNYPKNNIVINNALVNSGKGLFDAYTSANGRIENNIDISVPGFVDADNGNYLLREDSEIFKKIPEFKALPFTRMGRYTDRALKRVENGIVLAAESSQAIVGGEVKFIDPDNKAVKAQIIDGSTYVPIRFIAEALGGDVNYDSATRTITIKGAGTSVSMNVDSTQATVNSAPYELPQLPIIKEGRTLVPLRAVAELFNKKVVWEPRGLIVIDDREDVFSETSDEEIIQYLYELICAH
ncbi:MAG: hypothetical protein IKA17_08125 [Clostridia bacterium]|nr:hypothetical protein [Clostridia bacterium]